jgi:poly(ADP-ribose) glycohydrolase ARH3
MGALRPTRRSAVSLSLRDRFRGCLLGLAVGDALGALFEAQSAAAVRARFPHVGALFASTNKELWYTDDTQMTIGVAETLIDARRIDEARLCRAFVENYVPSRGYGRGARVVLGAMQEGGDYRAVAEHYFPGGSFGNGAAMRVAPVGLFFHADHARLWLEARLQSLPTHRHPLGIEGAQLLALGVALALQPFNRSTFFDLLDAACVSPEFRHKIDQASQVRSVDDLAALGNGIAALESVPTALASFALTPDSYTETVGNVILLGGDTDTIAAMAGALAGAQLGSEGVPSRLVELLESSPKGRDYLPLLADRLHAALGAVS